MEQSKYDKQSSIPAIELSTGPVDINVAVSAPPTEQNPPAAIGNEAVKADEDDLRVMQDDGGNGASARDVAKPATPAALPEPE